MVSICPPADWVFGLWLLCAVCEAAPWVTLSNLARVTLGALPAFHFRVMLSDLPTGLVRQLTYSTSGMRSQAFYLKKGEKSFVVFYGFKALLSLRLCLARTPISRKNHIHASPAAHIYARVGGQLSKERSKSMSKKRRVNRKAASGPRRAKPHRTTPLPNKPEIRLDDDKLTPRQQLFAQEYIVDLNGTQAALRAGYKPSTAHQAACVNLQKGHVLKAIKDAMDARAARTAITADRVLRELGRIGFCDPKAFYDDTGDVRAVGSLGRDHRAAIQQMKIHVEKSEDGEAAVYVKSIKFHSKLKALEMIAKHLGIMQERFELIERSEHTHTFKLDYTDLSQEEMQVLLKLIGAKYLSEEDVCPNLPRQ